MAEILIGIFSFIFAVLVLVGVHELGHFTVARRCGVKIKRFSIGFGKPLWRWFDKSGTEYVIALFPLGGYVKMLDEREGEVPAADLDKAFNRKPLRVRAAIVLAGPIFNFIFAVFALWLMYGIGLTSYRSYIAEIDPGSIAAEAGMKGDTLITQIDDAQIINWQGTLLAILKRLGEKDEMYMKTYDPSSQKESSHTLQLKTWTELKPWTQDVKQFNPIFSLGIVQYIPSLPPVIADVLKDSPAEKGGLEKGDRIVFANQEPIQTWKQFIQVVRSSANQDLKLTVQRDGELKDFVVAVENKFYFSYFTWYGYLGVKSLPRQWPADKLVTEQYNPLVGWWPAIKRTGSLINFDLIMLGKILTGKISTRLLGGPISIFQGAELAALAGVSVYLGFLSLLSVSLGIVNLLPIPGLDGSHLVYFVIEWIRKKPMPLAVEVLIFRLGVIILIVIMVQILINDLRRLVGG